MLKRTTALAAILLATASPAPSGAEPARVPRAVVPLAEAPEAIARQMRAGGDDRTVVEIPGAQWLQLRFEAVDLGGGTLTVRGEDGQSQTFDQDELEAWGGLTATFNGARVAVSRSNGAAPDAAEVVIGLPADGAEAEAASPLRDMLGRDLDRFRARDAFPPSPRGAPLEASGATQRAVMTGAAGIESICGAADDRVASNHPLVGRIMPVGCTGWLIPGGAMLTAAHCTGAGMQTVEFNVPASRADGTTVAPPVRDQYRIVAGSVRSSFTGIGNDWALFRTLPNTETGRTATAAQGGAFTLSNTASPQTITITGHGVDGPPPGFGRGGPRNRDNQTQQTHGGQVTDHSVQGPSSARIRYTADTQGGNSGGPIIVPGGTVAVGIHTNGGCTATAGSNAGTSFRNAALWRAIEEETSPVGPMIQVPGVGWEGAGAGLALANLDRDPRPEMVAMAYDDPRGANQFRYRIGRNLGADGVASSWSSVVSVPGVGWEGQGAGVALRDLGGSGRPEMVLMAYDDPARGNTFRYRVGRDVDANGAAASWSGMIEVAGVGWEGAGADVAFADLDGNPRPEMILMAYDDPARGNTFRYRVGFNLDANGVAASWGPMQTVAGVGWEGAGAGMAVGDFGGDRRPDLLLMAYDDPARGNTFRYRIGLDLDATGRAQSWRSRHATVDGVGWEGQGAGAAVWDFAGDGRPDLVTMAYDNPARANTFRYRVVRDVR